MPTSIITTDDLQDFKMELLEDIKQLLNQQKSGKTPGRKLVNLALIQKTKIIFTYSKFF